MVLDGRLKLLDVFCTALSEGCLSLPIPLLPFFRSCIDLAHRHYMVQANPLRVLTGFLPPFRFWTCATSCVLFWPSGS